MKIKYPVGTKFTPRGGKETRPEETVEDILRTYNAKDELVKVRYLCTHKFCGQRVRSEYPQTSLDLSNHKDIINGEIEKNYDSFRLVVEEEGETP